MDSDLLGRIQRINAAVGSATEKDFRKFPARMYQNERSRMLIQDFSGGRSEAELTNVLESLINNVANFYDHLQKWGEQHGISRASIHNFLQSSADFCVIRDLWNRDKHPYAPRDRGWSGKAPRIGNVRNVMKLTARGGKSATMTLGAHGQPVITDDGSSQVIVTADVLDKNGNGLGDVDRFLQGALRACEAALRTFGVTKR